MRRLVEDDTQIVSLSVRVPAGFKMNLSSLAHDYEMRLSELVREMLEQAYPKWRQAIDDDKARVD